MKKLPLAFLLRVQALQQELFPFNDRSSSFAEPWRRLLAAACDTFLIFLAHVAAVAVIVTYFHVEDIYGLFIFASPLFCWLYVLIGWSLGATIGMRVFRIRIVRESLEPVGMRCAILRIIGFVAACLPVRIGLLPIFFDAKRQGWHDRLAKTVVVKSNVPRDSIVAIPRPVSLLPQIPAPPDFREPWRGAWLVIPFYALLAIFFTWPVAAHIGTRIMGEGEDPYIFLWDYWWFKTSLLAHHSPLHTNLIFYPQDTSLALHTMQWFNCMIAFVLSNYLNNIAVYNSLNLLSMFLSGVCGYWLLAGITKRWKPASLAGMALGFSPFFARHALGHANLIAVEFVYLYALCIYAVFTSGRLKYAIWAGVWVTLSGLCDLQFLAFDALIGVSLFVGFWLYFERPSRAVFLRRSALLAVGFAVAGVCLAPIGIDAVKSITGGSMDKSRLGGYSSFKADLSDWLPDLSSNCILGHDIHRMTERAVSIGIVLFPLALLGVTTRPWKDSKLWTFMIVIFVILASGPEISINGRSITFIQFLFVGFPGNGGDLPWHTFSIQYYASMAVLGNILSSASEWDMPFSWLPSVLPLLKPFRVPVRFGLIVIIYSSLFSAFGIEFLFQTIKAKYGKLAGVGVLATLLSLVIVDFDMAPYSTFQPRNTDFLRVVKQEGALVELPCDGNELSAYYQTIHHRPLFRSFISRCPKNAMQFISSNNLLSGVPPANGCAKDLASLRAAGARWIVTDRSEKYSCLEKTPQLTKLWQDQNHVVYRIK
jgi:uncharacterized RDD family membrane protein YckC